MYIGNFLIRIWIKKKKNRKYYSKYNVVVVVVIVDISFSFFPQ